MSVLFILYYVVVGVILSCVSSLKVSIYYEALCSDSTKFIAKQLYPQRDELSKFIKLEFIPYGKATHNLIDGNWKFDCQHGPSECRGNIYQACALNQTRGQENDVSFVNCMMTRRDPSNLSSVEMCGSRYNYNIEKIKSCGSSEEGDILLASNGEKTYALEEMISFVPTIVFDDKYNRTLQNMSIKDFVAVVCSKLNDTKPDLCKNKKLPGLSYF